jgi:hypothetical protein
MSTPTTTRALTPYDVAELTPRALGSVYRALEAGMLAGKQNGNLRSAKWVISPRALDDWIERGCPFPPRTKRYPKTR